MKKWLLARCLEISMPVEILRKFLIYFAIKKEFFVRKTPFLLQNSVDSLSINYGLFQSHPKIKALKTAPGFASKPGKSSTLVLAL